MISVWKDPLFCVIQNNGERIYMGLWELLERAHELSELSSESITGRLATMRMILTFLLDIYEPETNDNLLELFESEHFDMEQVRFYIEKCEDEGVCFMLDDLKHPFMQSAYDPKLDGKALKPVSALLFDVPSGNNHIHLDHRLAHEHCLTPARAFEGLLASNGFCTAGTAGPSNVNNTPPELAIVYGRNLFETLVLNMVSKEAIGNIPWGKPYWRASIKVIPKQAITNMSLLLAWTWQPRRVTLNWEADGMVKEVYMQAGLDFRGNDLWRDPLVLFKKNKEDLLISLKPQLGRELWRDASTLTGRGARVRTTLPIMNISEVWENERPNNLSIEVAGLVTNNAAILGEVSERLVIPAVLVENEELSDQFHSALSMVEGIWFNLTNAVRAEFVSGKEYKGSGVVAEQTGEVYLEYARRFVFDTYMSALCAKTDDAMRILFDGLLNAVRSALSAVVEETGDDYRSLLKQVKVKNTVMAYYYRKRKENLIDE